MFKFLKLLSRKHEISKVLKSEPIVQEPKANSAIVKAMILAMKYSNNSGRLRRLSFERSLASFDKSLRLAGERYLAVKGIMYGDVESVGLSQNFFNCSNCVSAKISVDWHERSSCASGQSLKCGKQCLCFVPKCLKDEWIEKLGRG